MKVAVVGSRNLRIDDLGKYLPDGVTEIVSGGARGVDTSAREYALAHDIKLTEFLPEYDKYGRSAPLRRNITIIEYTDLVLAFWDGSSRGTKHVIDNCKRLGIPIKVFVPQPKRFRTAVAETQGNPVLCTMPLVGACVKGRMSKQA